MNHELEASFAAWLGKTLSQPMPGGLRAFNFNLSEAFQKFEVDLIGSNHYDPDNPDWVCEEIFISQPRFFDLPHATVGNRWQDVQKLVARFVIDYIRAAPISSPLLSAEAVTVGFVDGELEKAWPNQ